MLSLAQSGGLPEAAGEADPQQGLERLLDRGVERANRPVELGISRVAASGDRAQETVRLAPQVPSSFNSALPEGAPMPVPAAGFAYRIENEAVGVRAGSPAAAAEISPGETIARVKFVLPEQANVKLLAPEPFAISDEEPTVPTLLENVQLMPNGTRVALTIGDRGEQNRDTTQVAVGSVEKTRHDQLGDATGEWDDAEQYGKGRRDADGQRERDDHIETGEHGHDALADGEVTEHPVSAVAEPAPVVEGCSEGHA